MRKKLLVAVLALIAVWATGCIVVDAEKIQSHAPATIRSEECVVYQGPAADAPASERDGGASTIIAQR